MHAGMHDIHHVKKRRKIRQEARLDYPNRPPGKSNCPLMGGHHHVKDHGSLTDTI